MSWLSVFGRSPGVTQSAGCSNSDSGTGIPNTDRRCASSPGSVIPRHSVDYDECGQHNGAGSDPLHRSASMLDSECYALRICSSTLGLTDNVRSN